MEEKEEEEEEQQQKGNITILALFSLAHSRASCSSSNPKGERQEGPCRQAETRAKIYIQRPFMHRIGTRSLNKMPFLSSQQSFVVIAKSS
jgi:hypothetical protein